MERFGKVFEYVDAHKDEIVGFWRDLVNLDSGLDAPEGRDAVASKIADFLKEFGVEVNFVKGQKAVAGIIADYNKSASGAPVAFIGHYDTVFKKGTVEERPFKIEDGKAYGPGVLDMKGGVVIACYVLKVLKEFGLCDRPVRFVFAGDEESGHVESEMGDVFMKELKGALCAINFETGDVNNSLVVGRKGVIKAEIEVHGVAVHAGREPENGRNAILEMAHKIIDIQNLSDFEEGTTYNVGVIQGGTVANAVPDYAKVIVDVRYTDNELTSSIIGQLKEIAAKTYIDGTTTEIGFIGKDEVSYRPMAKIDGNMAMFDFVKGKAEKLGFGDPVIEPIVSGGASDSSFSVLAGVPTLDQMGVKGRWNHSPREFAVVDSIFERIKLVSACMADIDELKL